MPQEYTELYKKGLNDPYNHNGVVTHLEPDIRECEVKWALGSSKWPHKPLQTKLGGGYGIPAELFQIIKDDASKFGKLSSGHRTGKGQFSLQSQRKAMLKNVQTTIQLCSFCMLARLCSKSFELGFSRTSKCTTWVSKRKGTSDQIANIHWIIKKAREFQNHYLLLPH